jgi:bacterioferritin (cytochrome b1)
MLKLAQRHKDKVIDLLNERLAFERAGVKLYDTVLEKVRSKGEERFDRLVRQMQEFRDQEKEHEEWLEEQIRALGGDAHAETDKSELIKRESEGIEKVVFQSDSHVGHLFHAMLTAEMVDNAGWQLLLELADMADDDIARRAFSKRLHEEEEHLILMRRAVEGLARQEVLSQQAAMGEVEASPQP